MEKKRRGMPKTAIVAAGRLTCPYCGGFIGNAYYSAACSCVEVKCSNDRCKEMVRIEL